MGTPKNDLEAEWEKAEAFAHLISTLPIQIVPVNL